MKIYVNYFINVIKLFIKDSLLLYFYHSKLSVPWHVVSLVTCFAGDVYCNLSIPDNGNSSCNEEMILSNDMCNFTCNSGYELTGSRTRMCENGSWTGDITTCVRGKAYYR